MRDANSPPKRPRSAIAIACMAAKKPTQAMLDAERDFWRAFDAGDMAAMSDATDRMGITSRGVPSSP